MTNGNMNTTEQLNRATTAYEAASTKADEAEKKVNEAIERGDTEQDIQKLKYAHTEAVDILNDAYAECVDIVQGSEDPVTSETITETEKLITIEQLNKNVNARQEAYNAALCMLGSTYQCAESDQWEIVERDEKELGVCCYELDAAVKQRDAYTEIHRNEPDGLKEAVYEYETEEERLTEARLKVYESIERGDDAATIKALKLKVDEVEDRVKYAYAECVGYVQGTDYPIEVR